MTVGASLRTLATAAVVLGSAPSAYAVAFTQHDKLAMATAPTLQVEADALTVRTAEVSRSALPMLAASERRLAQSGIPVPLPPALMLLGTAVASLLGLRSYRRRPNG
jgi:hypothetical protein